MNIHEYLSSRRRVIDGAIASETLAGNDFKLSCKRSALAEITGIEAFLFRAPKSEESPTKSPNTGSPKCACPWIKPCDFCGEGGVCKYSVPNQAGALRADA
jgi:hypothetical protein